MESLFSMILDSPELSADKNPVFAAFCIVRVKTN